MASVRSFCLRQSFGQGLKRKPRMHRPARGAELQRKARLSGGDYPCIRGLTAWSGLTPTS